MGALWYEWLLIDPNVVFSAWLYLQSVFCILRTQTVSGPKPLLVLCVSNVFLWFWQRTLLFSSLGFLEFVIFLRLSWVEETKHVLLYLCLGVGVEATVVLSQSLSSLSSMGSVLSRSFQQTSLHVSRVLSFSIILILANRAPFHLPKQTSAFSVHGDT